MLLSSSCVGAYYLTRNAKTEVRAQERSRARLAGAQRYGKLYGMFPCSTEEKCTMAQQENNELKIATRVEAKQTTKKPPVLFSHGLLADQPNTLRAAIGIILALTCATLTFTQLGFIGVDLPDGSSAYVVGLLPVIALGSLLLGSLEGAAIGLVSGAVLYAHSKYLPLDHFELLYVTPVTSVVMFAVAGYLLGALFAFALRKNPSRARRAVYIAIVSILVSWAYTFGFFTSAFISFISYLAENISASTPDAQLRELAVTAFGRLGRLDVQAWWTAGLTAVVCCVADWRARKFLAHEGSYGLRSVFSAWLSVAVVLAFMAIGAVTFAVTTSSELREAVADMANDIGYLRDQLKTSNEQTKSLISFLLANGMDYEKMNIDDFTMLLAAVSPDALLQSYDANRNGIVVITVGQIIDMSNSNRFAPNELTEYAFSDEMKDAIEKSVQTGTMQRFVDDGTTRTMDGAETLDENGESSIQPRITYLLASSFVLENQAGDSLTYTIAVMEDSDQVFAARGPIMTWTTISSLILMFIVGGVVLLLLHRMVARRIDEENAALELITAGNLDARATASGTREFDSLTSGINTTVDALKGWIAEAETRMDAELATAKAIQENALPRTFPPYPDIMRFDIYASMNAAKEVGGDFYDFFLIGDECGPDAGKLGFVVADVSGKGVPAALFMMKAKALLRDYVGSGMELGEAVAEANNLLCDGNDAGMFVTAWVGVLDYGTGHVDYVNAGHNPPLLWAFNDSAETQTAKHAQAGSWQWVADKSGLPLGLFGDMPYTAYSRECLPGEMFLLYSDGVTEAMDVNENLYGEDRLMAVAQDHYLLHPHRLLEAVREDVAAHASGAEQSDDITILALEVGVPPEITATLDVPAVINSLAEVNDFLHAELDRRLCPRRVQHQLDLVVEELFVNVCHYAYPDATPDSPGMARVQRTYSTDPSCIVVNLIDSGIPFDPLAKPDVELADNIEDMAIGGLGIFMVKQLVDDIRYERVNEQNVVTIVKKW